MHEYSAARSGGAELKNLCLWTFYIKFLHLSRFGLRGSSVLRRAKKQCSVPIRIARLKLMLAFPRLIDHLPSQNLNGSQHWELLQPLNHDRQPGLYYQRQLLCHDITILHPAKVSIAVSRAIFSKTGHPCNIMRQGLSIRYHGSPMLLLRAMGLNCSPDSTKSLFVASYQRPILPKLMPHQWSYDWGYPGNFERIKTPSGRMVKRIVSMIASPPTLNDRSLYELSPSHPSTQLVAFPIPTSASDLGLVYQKGAGQNAP